MGQYLSVYLVAEVSVDIDKDKEVTVESVNEALRRHGFILDLSLYNLFSTDRGAYIELKPSVLRKNLHPLMKAFYLYCYGSLDEYLQKILDDISQMKDIHWEGLQEHITQHYCMEDCTVLPYYYPWDGITAKGIVLICSEKIMTEGCTHVNRLFTKLLRDKFSRYKLSRILKVDELG